MGGKGGIYGLWAMRLCGSAALGALAPWRLGDAGARCVCLLDRVSMRLAVRMPRALCMCKHGRGLRGDQGTRRAHTITKVELPI